jgi:hypothetical protein
MEDTEDTKEMLGKILVQEMRRLGLAMVSRDELRIQRLIKASKQIAFIASELDKYASIPEKYNVLLAELIGDVNSIWSQLKEEDVITEDQESELE